jgi:glycosyltransferase involved in cell wall biosynthesis
MKADLLHAYEYPLILDAFYGPARSLGTPLVGTVYAMAIPTWLPRTTTFIAGTKKLVAGAREVGQRTTLIEPPVNPDWDDPVIVDGTGFRRMHGIDEDEVVLGIVCRLNRDMKQEGIVRAMRAVQELDGRLGRPLRLVITGDGPARDELTRAADFVNATLRRGAVVMSGPLADPRSAYAAADIALNMGGSALRAMSFAKPLIVLGIEGFSRPFDESTAGHFFYEGFYGIGAGQPDPLAEQIAALMDEGRRRSLGAWSRQVVLDRYSLEQAVDTLELVFEQASRRSSRWLPAALRTTIQRTVSEMAGQRLRDRFRPIVRQALVRQASR